MHLSRKFTKNEIKIFLQFLKNKNQTEFSSYINRIESLQPKYFDKNIKNIIKELK